MSGQLRGLRVARLLVASVVLALAGGIAFLGVISWFGALHWTIELVSHFRVYFFALGVLLAVLALGLGYRGPAAVVGLVGVINGVAAWPYIVPPEGMLPPGTRPPVVRVLWANLGNWSTDLPALQRLIEWEKPDVAVFTELAADHQPVLRAVRELLPFQSPLPDGGPLDLMLLSKSAPVSVHFDLANGVGAPLLIARLCPGEACFTLLGLHTSRPFPHRGGARDQQIDYAAAVARRLVDQKDRVVLIGDLNLTPFSPVFDRLAHRSGLENSMTAITERPRAAVSTWWFRNSWIGLPIDHALLSPGVILVERRLGTGIGSDHTPLIVDIRLAR